MHSTGSTPRISFETAPIIKNHAAKDTSDVLESKKTRREIKEQRKSLDSFLSENKPNIQSPLLSKGPNIDVNHIMMSSGSGGGGSGGNSVTALDTEMKQKRTQRHTLGSTPLKQYVEESHINPNFLPDIASNFKKQHQEKPKTPAITTPFQLLDVAVNEVEESSSPNIRRQQSDMVTTVGPSVGGGPFLPVTMLDRKNRTDSFMSYSSIKSSVTSLIRQFPESSKSASAAVSSTKKQTTSTSSILLRIRMGGAIIAGPLAKDAIEAMALQQKELKILKDAFDKMDEEKECCITSVKLFAALEKIGYKRNNFAMKVYQLIDLEGNGSSDISFGAFVRLSATFLMFTPSDLLRFVFQSYNKKGQGMFGIEDFSDLTADINPIVMGGGPRKWSDVLKYDNMHQSKLFTHGDSSSSSSSSGLVEEIPKKGYLTEEEFAKMSLDYPSLLCFATKLQTILQEHFGLGTRFYKKILHRQECARAIEEYRNTNVGELPKEEFSMQSWFRKVAYIASVDDEPDLTKRDNSKLLELGFGLYTNLQKTIQYNRRNHTN